MILAVLAFAGAARAMKSVGVFFVVAGEDENGDGLLGAGERSALAGRFGGKAVAKVGAALAARACAAAGECIARMEGVERDGETLEFFFPKKKE